jgi:serine/threonine protein kinase
MTDPDPLHIVGELIADKYRIERKVGEGGFAVVYRAEHVVWQRPVAVKLFSGLSQAPVESRDALTRDFIREGALLTELSSQTAGIVQAWDVGTYATPDGQWMPYMVLEWLEGSPLDAVLDQDQAQRMPWTEGEASCPSSRSPTDAASPTATSSPPTSSSWGAPRDPRPRR